MAKAKRNMYWFQTTANDMISMAAPISKAKYDRMIRAAELHMRQNDLIPDESNKLYKTVNTEEYGNCFITTTRFTCCCTDFEFIHKEMKGQGYYD